MTETVLPIVLFALVTTEEPSKTLRYYDNYSDCRAAQYELKRNAYCHVLTVRNTDEWNQWLNQKGNNEKGRN